MPGRFKLEPVTNGFEVWDENHLLEQAKWSFLTATYDASAGKASLYLNGQLVSQKIIRKNMPMKEVSVPLIMANTTRQNFMKAAAPGI